MNDSDSMDARHGAGPDTVAVVVVVVGEAVLVVVVVGTLLVDELESAVAADALVVWALPPPELPQAARSRTTGRTSALFMFRCSSIA